MSKIHKVWETIDNETSRMRVHNGWVIKTAIKDQAGFVELLNTIFIPDVTHDWDLNECLAK